MKTVVDTHEFLASVKRPLLVPLTSVVIEPPENEVLHNDGLAFLNSLINYI